MLYVSFPYCPNSPKLQIPVNIPVGKCCCDFPQNIGNMSNNIKIYQIDTKQIQKNSSYVSHGGLQFLGVPGHSRRVKSCEKMQPT